MSGQAGGVRQPQKLSEVTENSAPRAVAIRPVAVVSASAVVACVRGWVVSALCPFGCVQRVHAFSVPSDSLLLWDGIEYCVASDVFYSVIIPKKLRYAAYMLLVES